jgi:hypothetical protein
LSEVEEEEDAAGSSAGKPIVGTVTGPIVVNPQDRKSWLRRYKVALALFVAFGVTLAFAVAAYPKRAPIDRPPPITVSLSTAETLDQAYLQIAALPNHSYQISIDVVTGSAFGSTNGYASGNLTLPAGAVVLPGCLANCIVHPSVGFGIPGTVDFSSKTFTPFGSESSGGEITSVILFMTIKAPAFAWEANGVNAETWIPEFTITAPSVFELTPPISVKYDITDVTGYDWSGGPSLNGHYWSLMPDQVTSPIALTGTNSSAASRDSLLTFVSGVVLGISGGALVGAIQETVHAESDEPRRRRRSRTPNP